MSHDHHPEPTPEDPGRRRWFTRLSLAVGALISGVLLTGPVGMALNPLLKKSGKAPGEGEGDADAWAVAGPVSGFELGGTPARVVLKEDRQDAWLKQSGVPVGSVLVQRVEGEDFRVFSAVCPHLGCSVGYQEKRQGFHCPCHNSAFAVGGEREEHADGAKNPAPRGLDPLIWRVRSGRLEVQWVRYKTGNAERVRIG